MGEMTSFNVSSLGLQNTWFQFQETERFLFKHKEALDWMQVFQVFLVSADDNKNLKKDTRLSAEHFRNFTKMYPLFYA